MTPPRILLRCEGCCETLVLGSSRSLDCGGLIHNTSCPAPPSQQAALRQQNFSSSSSLHPPGEEQSPFSLSYLMSLTSLTAVKKDGKKKNMQIR